MEKAEMKEKERLKEETRKQKRLESNFKQLLKIKLNSLTEQSKWEDVKEQIENDNDYLALSSESDRIRLFEEYHRQVIVDAQAAAAAAAAAAHHSHHHHKKARKEKKKRKHEKSNSSNTAPVSVSYKKFFILFWRNLSEAFIRFFRIPMVKKKRNLDHQQQQQQLLLLLYLNQCPLMQLKVMKVKQKIVMVLHQLLLLQQFHQLNQQQQ